MNNLGYSKKNVFIGDVRVKGQDETVIIGNENGGPGYILPEEKGTPGQVITMDATGNTTSFQDGASSTIERPIQNLFTMLTPRTSYTTGNADPYWTASSGSEVIDTSDFKVGDAIRVRVEGYYVNLAANPATTPCTITHQWFISWPNTSPSEETLSTPVQFNESGGNWFNEIIFTWESASSVRITFNGQINYNPGAAVSDNIRALNWFVGGAAPPGTARPKSTGAPYYVYPPPAVFQIRGQNRTDAGSGYSIATNYYIDKMNVDALTSGGGSPSIDHLTLSNLNAASGSGDVDAGHQTLVCLDGRSGGQQITGGRGTGTLILKSNDTTPLINNIELGSGLDTKIHKIFSNSVATPLVIEHESVVDKIDLRINNNNKVEVKDTEIKVNESLNMNNNAINNVLNINSGTNINLNPTGFVDINGDVDMGSNRILGAPEIIGNGGDMTIRNGGGESILLNAATNTIDILNNNLNMNNNIISNVNSVTSSGTLSLESVGGGAQRIELDGTFMTFFNNTINPSITPSGFDVNNGEINNANTVKSSTNLQLKAGNNTGIIIETAPNDTIIFEKSTNHNGNVLDNVGVGVIQDIVNCNTINGLTPVGGLFSGTSDSLNVAATTTETSILPLTFVGAGFSVPPNGFSVGDCFLLNLSGPFNSNNNDTLTIRLKGGPTSTTLLSTLVVPLNASSSSVFQLSVFFQIRAIGAATVADIVSDADLTYNQSGAGGSFVGEQSLSQNNTTFDTTVANVLDVTAQFSSTSANNDMTTRVSKLQKTF